MNPTGNRHSFWSLFHNWISLAGLMLAGSALFAFILLFAIDLTAHNGNPYMGILAYVVAPGFLFLGLGIAGFGAWRSLKIRRQAGEEFELAKISIDLSKPAERRRLLQFSGGAILFLLLTALGSYQTYEYTDSVNFCGQTCHTPMEPEFIAYLDSPHARVACTECHVGSGAEWYLKAKINGVHQLISAVTDTYSRPIPTPVKNLRPAQDTCEHCHWRERDSGNLERTYEHFLADEENTPFTVRMILKVGGGGGNGHPGSGIHWHMNLANQIEYITTDPQRKVIPWVRLTDAAGKQTVFKTEEFTGSPEDYEIRRMDCLDCHNRPAHQFNTPNDAVEVALARGRIDRSVPWVKSNLVAALTAEYRDKADAAEGIATRLTEAYANQAALPELIKEAHAIYSRNFFPEMKADWRAYPDHSGHKDSDGCFRCHSGRHFTEDKRLLSASSCNDCHLILAQGSGDELKNLSADGHAFFHVDSEYEDYACAVCHNGAIMEE